MWIAFGAVIWISIGLWIYWMLIRMLRWKYVEMRDARRLVKQQWTPPAAVQEYHSLVRRREGTAGHVPGGPGGGDR